MTGQLKLLLKYNLSAGMRVSGSNICLISCILPSSKGAGLYTVLSSVPCAHGQVSQEVPSAGECARPAVLCIVFLEMGLQGRAESNQRCNTCLPEMQHYKISENWYSYRKAGTHS